MLGGVYVCVKYWLLLTPHFLPNCIQMLKAKSVTGCMMVHGRVQAERGESCAAQINEVNIRARNLVKLFSFYKESYISLISPPIRIQFR